MLSLWAALILTIGCNTTKPAVATTATPPPPPPDLEVTETRDLDTLTVSPATNSDSVIAPPPPRAIAFTRVSDLLHTKLEVSFDWEKEMVMGVATLRMKPVFKPIKEVTLDAKNFTFNSITTAGGTALDYTYEGDKQQVTIELDKYYTRGQEFTLIIDYTATRAASGRRCHHQR